LIDQHRTFEICCIRKRNIRDKAIVYCFKKQARKFLCISAFLFVVWLPIFILQVHRNLKFKMYKIVISYVNICDCESRYIALREESSFKVFKNRVLKRKIWKQQG
jgi:hypothetical protein